MVILKEARYKEWDVETTLAISIPIQRAHKAVVGLVLLIIFTIVTAALCVIGIMMYGKRSKRSVHVQSRIFYYIKASIVSSVEPVKYTRYSKLPVDEPDEGNPFEDDDDEMLK